MDLNAKKKFINEFSISKNDVLESIKAYIQHCEVTMEEDWSESKRKVILDILFKFYSCVQDIRFPDIQSPDWYFEYMWTRDGIALELVYCDNIEIDEYGEIKSMEQSGFIKLAEIKCNYLCVEEYAQKYNVTVTAVRQWIRRGKLRSAKKVGRDWIIPELSDRPKRGYEPVTYRWSEIPKTITKEFSYLERASAIHIVQDSSNKSVFVVMLLNEYERPFEKIRLDIKERERLELALISEANIESKEWYQDIIFVPAKQTTYYLKGERIMFEEEWKEYEAKMRLLKDNNLEISTSNSFYDELGMYVWGFSATLIRNVIDAEGAEEEYKVIVNLNDGMIIPSESEFNEEDEICEYVSAGDFCDAISAEMLAVYETIAEMGVGIKSEIIKELGMKDYDSYESSILYIKDIEAENLNDLKMFLQLFEFLTEGLPAKYCKFAVVLMNWKFENEKAKIFLECGWKIKNLDDYAIVAYRKL